MDWQRNQIDVRRHKTDTHFHVPIYDHLRPLLDRMNRARRGKRSPASPVFKIKDAKKALGAACDRLKFPSFCQRGLRQHLIGRLWRAGVDRKLIASWQGHQDGGQLILDTYTQVFGSDDEEYVRGQLAKIGGGAPSGSPVAESTSASMKVLSNHDAPVDPHPTTTHPATSAVVNPYRKGDKVKTACKGVDVDAEVTAVFKDEVQVRTPDGELRWRTVRTVQPLVVLLTPPDPLDVNESLVEAAKNSPRKRGRAGKKKRR